MRKKLPVFVTALVAMCALQAQNISVNSAVGQNIGTFLSNNLLGEGVYIYNAKFNGIAGNIPSSWNQVGKFTSNGYPALSMDEGIILTTGKIATAVGPNNSTGASNQVSSPYVDNLMAPLLSGNQQVMECATIDFDFVCLSDFVSFTYCFASEEYREYVFSDYNDIFAFFLTGVDPMTGDTVTRNIAIVPGSVDSDHPDGIPVAINTVNNGSSNASFQNSYDNGNCAGCYMFSQYFYDNDTLNNYYSSTFLDGVQYDGMTNKLTASASVIPCQSYHMHISVCNVSDMSYDSGVFLEGNSFSTPTAAIGLSQNFADSIRRGTIHDIPLSLAGTGYNQGTITIGFGGQAVSGIDFFCLDDNGIVINNGEQISINAEATSHLHIQPLTSANLSTPKSLDVYYATSLCPEYPELLVHDTMHFFLVEGQSQSADTSVSITTQASIRLGIAPNPASRNVSITAVEPLTSISFVDATGREALAFTLEKPSARCTLDVSQLAPGSYLISAVSTSGNHLVGKIIITAE